MASAFGLAATLGIVALLPSAHSSRAPAPSRATLLERAESLLVRDCMRRRGFDVPAVAPTTLPDDRSFPYVVDDVRWARAHGYGSDIYAEVERVRQADPVLRYLQGLSTPQRRAALASVNGSPSDPSLEAELPSGAVVRRSATSCTSRAQQQLYGDVRAWYRVTKVTENLPPAWISRVLDDPRYAAAVREWSTCMRERGFPYASPTEARKGATGRPAETDTAVAEATCAGQTGLARIVDRLEARYAAAVRQRFRSDLETKDRLERAALPRARALVTG